MGSAQLISDCQGKEYERIEYTPYGETWIEKTRDGLETLPFRFTGKELDEETGFYYYGARYLNPKTSVWISADPALGDYMPVAPISDDAKNHNQKLPGLGGVFNLVNLNLYHYAANNPVRYTDPDGREDAMPAIKKDNGQSSLPSWLQDADIAVSRFASRVFFGVPANGWVMTMEGFKVPMTDTDEFSVSEKTFDCAFFLLSCLFSEVSLFSYISSADGIAYRYVGEEEARIAASTGYIPNTNMQGHLKNVFISPNKYTTVAEAEKRLQIGVLNPIGKTASPVYRVTIDITRLDFIYAENVEGGRGLELVTNQRIPIIGIDPLK